MSNVGVNAVSHQQNQNGTMNPMAMNMQQLQMQQWQLQQQQAAAAAAQQQHAASNGVQDVTQQMNAMNMSALSPPHLINNNPQQQLTNTLQQQFAFPAAPSVMMAPPTFTPQLISATNQPQNTQNTIPTTTLPRQTSNDSHNSGAQSPASNHSGSSNEKRKNIFTKKQQQLGDVLYQKVFAKCGATFAPKITGMLIKMGDQKAQQYIDDSNLLDEQIKIAKTLLQSQQGNLEGVPDLNHSNNMVSNINGAPTLLHQQSGSPTNQTLINRLQTVNPTFSVNTALTNPNQNNALTPTHPRYQALNTKPISPNPNPLQTTQQPQMTMPQTITTSSIPNLFTTSSIPNSFMGQLPGGNMALFTTTPSLLAMSPAPSAMSSQPQLPIQRNGTNQQQQATLQQGQNGNSPQANTNGHLTPTNNTINKTNPSQYLFTTNLLSNPMIVTNPTSPATHLMYNTGTPNSMGNGISTDTINTLQQQQQLQQLQQQQASIAQGGWGLAVNPGIGVIQTQPSTQFIQPSTVYPRIQ
eukprot:338194_1